MQKSTPPRHEVTDPELIEDIYQLKRISLGEGAATCQVCGTTLTQGETVVVYVFRPAGTVGYQVGYITCDDEAHDHPTEFTLGVRELVLEGRVGQCADSTTQSAWPVLLAPTPVTVSATPTTTHRDLPDHPEPSLGGPQR